MIEIHLFDGDWETTEYMFGDLLQAIQYAKHVQHCCGCGATLRVIQ